MDNMEAGTGTSWFSEQLDLDHVITSLPHVDWDTNSPAVELSEVDLDAALWSSWDDLLVDDNHGCPVNNLSLPTELEAIDGYIIDADRRHDNNNIEEDPISRPQSDPIVFRCPIDTELHPAALFAADRPLSDSAVVTNKSVSPSVDVDPGDFEETEYKGLRIVHLLTACAEALSQGAEDVMEVILCRLRQLVSPTGSTMERVAYYLYHALLHSKVNSLDHLEPNDKSNSLAHLKPNDKSTKDHFLGAFKLLHVAYPYIQIPHFTANQCILEAVAAAGVANNVGIHIIDFDILEGMQWPPLMEVLRNHGNLYGVSHLRITAIKWAEDEQECLLYCGQTGRRLSEYANSVGLPFSFQERDLKGLKQVLPLHQGETVILNCLWQLPHMLNLRPKSQLLEFLISARHLNPKAVTLATGPQGAESKSANFLDSFGRCLEDLCAIFDSLEAGLPQHGLARAMVERIFFGPAMSRRVVSSSACGPPDTRKSNVVDLPLECGYGECSISNDTMSYAKYTLQSVRRGCYEVELVGDHRLVLKWGSTPLVWLSSWKSTSTSSCI